MKIKQQKAFTLIELMVVVAIIAILASMGVANFSTAIKKARNSVRMNDVLAVSKAMEVCYDIGTGKYGYEENKTYVSMASQTAGGLPTSNGPFLSKKPTDPDTVIGNKCLDQNVVPKLDTLHYGANVTRPEVYNKVEKYVVCAELENVGGWESLGNYSNADGIGVDGSGVPDYESFVGSSTPCTSSSQHCLFCVASQQ